MELQIVAAGFKRAEATYTAYWKTTPFLQEQNTNITEREEEEVEPTIISTHYEDETGKKIQDLDLGKVTLVIQTEEGENDHIDIDLAEEEFDFLYQGKPLKNDLLEHIAIHSSGITRIALEVIPKDDPETEHIHNNGIVSIINKHSKFKTSKSLIDVPKVPNVKALKKKSGIITPTLSKVATDNLPQNMQSIITDYPDDVLADVTNEGLRQDVIIAAANPKDSVLQDKGITAGQELFGKAITVIAVAGTAYSLFKSGQKMIQQVESVSKFLKKMF